MTIQVQRQWMYLEVSIDVFLWNLRFLALLNQIFSFIVQHMLCVNCTD